MSTRWGYKCLDCGESSKHWLNHGADTLANLTKHEEALNKAVRENLMVEVTILGAYESPSPLEWLEKHRGHNIVLENEYGGIRNMNRKNSSPILIGCEESQTICGAFRRAGYEAYSCDIQPTRGNTEWHYQQDIMDVIPTRQWGLIILHPDCTAMAVSGNRWYGRGMPMHDKRQQAVKWTLRLWNLAKQYSPKVALENPVSVIFKHLPNVHYIQPWQFGHGETKKTGFALHNLPPLEPTSIVDGREQRVWKMPPGKNRKRDRSKTYPGVAKAIVEQWS